MATGVSQLFAFSSQHLKGAAACVLGVAHAYAFAPWTLPWLQVAVLAALFWLACTVHSARAAAALGALFGLGWFGFGVWWVYISMHRYGGMPAPLSGLATLAFCAWLALFPALALGVAARGRAHRTAYLLLIAPACWGISEWLRGVVLTGFPWIASGYAHTDGPLAGYAPVLGVYGVSWMAALVAGCAVYTLQIAHTRWPSRMGALVMLLAIIGVGATVRSIQWSQPHGAPIHVRLVQGNIKQDDKFGPLGLQLAHQTHMALLEEPGDIDLAVLPESVFPMAWNWLPSSIQDDLTQYVTEYQRTLIFGTFIEEPVAHFYNSALALQPDGSAQAYRKRHLVPFGEFIPWGFRWFVDQMHIPIGDQARGARFQPTIQVANQRIALNICYEDLFGAEVIDAWHEPERAPNILINVSNLAWFDDSIALDQHLQVSRMRALETARPMLRATNTGASAIIDAHGHVVAALPYVQTAVLDGRVQGTTGITPYVRWGNGLALAAMAWCWVLGMAWIRLTPKSI